MKTDAGDDAGSGCAPATSFDDGGAPTWTPPATPSNVCSTQDIANFYQACFVATSSTACDDWNNANATCGACLVTAPDAQALGPLLHDGDWAWANIAGCIALASGDTSASGCGAKEFESDRCDELVCSHCQDPYAYLDCMSAAQLQPPCATYDAAMCTTPDAGAVYDLCFSETTFEDYVTKLGALFCSNGSADASTD